MASWAASMGLAALTKAKADPKLWLLFFTFSQMQLAEFFIWKDLNNPYFAAFGLFVILMEPVVSINLIKSKLMWVIYGAMVTWALMTTDVKFKSEVAPNGHLNWRWAEFDWKFWAVWLVGLLAPVYLAGYT